MRFLRRGGGRRWLSGMGKTLRCAGTRQGHILALGSLVLPVRREAAEDTAYEGNVGGRGDPNTAAHHQCTTQDDRSCATGERTWNESALAILSLYRPAKFIHDAASLAEIDG